MMMIYITNIYTFYIRTDTATNQDLRQYTERLTEEDIDAYVGILLHLSVTGGYSRPLEDLWSQRIGDDFCRCTMSWHQFAAINRFIR